LNPPGWAKAETEAASWPPAICNQRPFAVPKTDTPAHRFDSRLVVRQKTYFMHWPGRSN